MPSNALAVAVASAAVASAALAASVVAAGQPHREHRQQRPIQQQRHGGHREHSGGPGDAQPRYFADGPTTEQIRQVIASLDAPEPQVLIKVVFVEVDDNKAPAIGVQGSYTGLNKNFSQVTGYMTNYSYNPFSSPATCNYAPGSVSPTGFTPVSQSYTCTTTSTCPSP